MLDYSSDNNSNNGMNDYIIGNDNDDTTNANNKNEGDNTSKNHNDNNNGDELTFLRIRSKKKEILIAPDNEFLMVVIQNPNASIPL